MHLLLSCPTTPCAGNVGGFVGEFCQRTPQGGMELVISTFRESVCKCAWSCGHSGWTLRTRYLMVQLQNLSDSWNEAVSFYGSTYCMTKTKFSDVLFQNSKFHSSVSRGLFNLNPPSGWGFVKSEVQIPIHPPIYHARGVLGLDIDRCIREIMKILCGQLNVQCTIWWFFQLDALVILGAKVKWRAKMMAIYRCAFWACTHMLSGSNVEVKALTWLVLAWLELFIVVIQQPGNS